METLLEIIAKIVMVMFVASIPPLYFAFYFDLVRKNKEKRDRWEKNETSKDH